MRKPFSVLALLLALALVVERAGFADDDPFPAATAESQGMSSDALRVLSETIRARQYDVRSLLIVRRGRLVLEWYAGGVTRDHNHNVYSVTKSFTATLAGIAMAEGDDLNVATPLARLFPDHHDVIRNSPRAAITLEDLLTMRSGMPTARANKKTGPQRELFQQVHRAPDRVLRILQIPLVRKPGKTFNYSNPEPQLVLGAVERATGEKTLAFAERALFEPLGFENYTWRWPDQQGLVAGGYGLRLRAIDMAKLGQLYLDDGKLKGRQLLPAEYAQAAVSDVTKTGYGYYWWTNIPVGENRSFAARGLYGQLIQVIPEQGVVVVINANLPLLRIRPILDTLVNDHVAAAIHSDKALPANPTAQEGLERELGIAAEYVPPARHGLPKDRLPAAKK